MTGMPTRRLGECFERHSLGTIQKIESMGEKIERLETDLQNQRVLTTVGILASEPHDWPLVCHEAKTSKRYWIAREDGTYWAGLEWSNAYDKQGLPEFALTYSYRKGCELIKKRFWRGFAWHVRGERLWMRPPSLVLVRLVEQDDD